MNAVSVWVVVPVALGLGLIAGAVAALSWKNRASRKRQRVPLYWPVNNRRVANSEELKVWRWLIKTFPDHHILIKIPITRFTIPKDEEKGLQLYKLLNALYCSFTVCSAAGVVVGCVDIPAMSRISKRNIQLKEGILFQRQIGYWVLNSSSLPEPSAIRSKFLGEADGVLNGAKVAGAEKAGAGASSADQFGADSGDFWSELNQQNSFLSPIDSRRAELQNDR